MSALQRSKSGRLTISLKSVFLPLVAALMFLAVVIPNSLQITTMILLIGSAAIALPIIKWTRRVKPLLFLHVLNTIATLFYIIIGLTKGAPLEAAWQVLAIYVISPFLWLVIAIATFQVLDRKLLESMMTIYGLMAVASVGIFYCLYMTLGAGAVSFFKENANIHYKDGYAGATMFVYGSLIFIAGGFYASPGIVGSKILRIVLLLALALAAITSGRSAFLLSVLTGALMGLFLQPRLAGGFNKQHPRAFKSLMRGITAAAAIFGVVLILPWYTDVDVQLIAGEFLEKLGSAGGNERSEQGIALLQGVAETYGLGAGHGIGVDYIRSDNFPWRYELVWLATVFRVGLIGSLIYAMAFLMCFFAIARLARYRKLSEMDLFMASAFVCVMLASNTNPYIEAFSFQWMFVLPLVWFIVRPQEKPLASDTDKVIRRSLI